VKPDKRNNPQERDAARPKSSASDVEPDQPFPDPDPNGPDDDQKIDEAYEGRKYGEGNYEAAKDYGKRVRSFVRSGEVERAADEAAPRDPAEAQAMATAEREGRERSKGEDPSGAARIAKKHDVKR
jgi:hypothetical protein